MAVLPEYLTDQTEAVIRQRMLDALPPDLDKSEGGFLWDAISPSAIELALAAIWAQQVLERGFAQTTFGAYLDLRAEEHGITRRAAVAATGTVTFTGSPGVSVPAGSRVSTASSATTPAVVFSTTAAAAIGAGGTVNVAVQAVTAGAAGNVAAGAIAFLADPVAGVTAVTNAAATSGGADEETDAALLVRYLQKVRSPSTGGNKADYVNWALALQGVGGVSVVPVRDGPGTVSLAIINDQTQPASQALIDQVQAYIAPPWSNLVEAESMTLGGSGVSIDTTQPDTPSAVKMVYSSTGAGMVTHTPTLQQPGIWQVRLLAKVDATTGTTDLLQVGIWNIVGSAWAKVSPSSATDAVTTLRAADLATALADVIQAFYWNGQDQIELRVTRLQTDTATTVWLDRADYRSTFSKDTGEGKAPIGARVTVEAAKPVIISISATLTVASGYNVASVRAAAQQAISDYLRSIAFADDNDVRYVRIGQAILDTPGVQDYSNLLVNGSMANVTVGAQEVATLGTVTWS